MSYERGRTRGRKAAKYGVSVGILVLISGLYVDPTTPTKWFLVGGGAYLAVSIVSLALMYLRPPPAEAADEGWSK